MSSTTNVGDVIGSITRSHVKVIAGGCEFSAEELAASTESLDPSGVGAVAICVPDGALTVTATLWAWHAEVDTVLLHAESSPSEAQSLAHRFGCSHLLTGNQESRRLRFSLTACEREIKARKSENQRITLLTSGTTGEAKPVTHNWEDLARSVSRRPELEHARWMSLYPLTRFAGFNTLLHAVWNRATLIVPRAVHPRAILQDIRETGATHASGTPTLWRNLLMAVPSGQDTLRSLRQITLGGEVVDQQILNALKFAAPEARLTHIYATTELGVCVAVSDGLAGFPASWLDNEEKRPQLQVRGDELWVKHLHGSGSGADADCDGWATAGDLVEVKDGRVYFKGRRGEILNIGGAKVLPAVIEERIGEVPGVVGARVKGLRNPISGAVVGAEVVGRSGTNEQTLRATILQHCRTCLPSYAVPRIITFVDSLPTSASGKILREANKTTNE